LTWTACTTTPAAGPQAGSRAQQVRAERAHRNIDMVSMKFTGAPRDYNLVAQQADDMVTGGDLEQAKKILLDAVGTVDPATLFKLPAVENATLYVYGFGWAEGKFPFGESEDWSMPTILDTLPRAESARLMDSMKPRIRDLYKAKPWKKVDFVSPAVPWMYYLLAYIAAEDEDLTVAQDYLSEALAYWPDYVTARAELAYIQTQTRDFMAARRTAQEALEGSVGTLTDQAALYRSLGYVSEEELSFDEAQGYYNSALAAVPGDTASLGELDYIKGARRLGAPNTSGVFRHVTSQISFPPRAGEFTRVGVALNDRGELQVRYRVAGFPDVWADLGVAISSGTREAAGTASLANLRARYTDLQVVVDWRDEPAGAGMQPMRHSVVASRKAGQIVEIWQVWVGSWTLTCTTHNPAGLTVLAYDQPGGLQAVLDELVQSLGYPSASAPLKGGS
jgi:tetratricopeptide (TPR) repeat protein